MVGFGRIAGTYYQQSNKGVLVAAKMGYILLIVSLQKK
jgi:hypothetical protein